MVLLRIRLNEIWLWLNMKLALLSGGVTQDKGGDRWWNIRRTERADNMFTIWPSASKLHPKLKTTSVSCTLHTTEKLCWQFHRRTRTVLTVSMLILRENPWMSLNCEINVWNKIFIIFIFIYRVLSLLLSIIVKQNKLELWNLGIKFRLTQCIN